MKETVTGIDKLWKDYNDLHQAEEIIEQLKTKIWHEINQQLKEKDNGID